ncbi:MULTISPECIES: ankyrin repeat domain-containing protein [unclassified Neochlamydia]|uniref:ankyrin repeat domain-containing protein n=1 Tax=unclassified Neochlamydia TaxID=2643326 RepID=UPI00140C99AE|nr:MULTISPECIES: ankyrin repeat domain-containing protein [unclassified Neochlamydia]NGY95923.1 hypothetical protein [Neochlamydia sp. AcF84]
MSSCDHLLAWQLQVHEYKKCLQANSPNSSGNVEGSLQGRTFWRLSQGKTLNYKVRNVPGDRDCFFHAVNKRNLSRDSLIKKLEAKAQDKDVRKAFASEIRQFLYLGCTGGHEDSAEQEAFKNIVEEEFRALIKKLAQSENILRELINKAREELGKEDTKGRRPDELLELLQGNESTLAQEFSNAYQTRMKIDKEIISYCSDESIYKAYVKYYLQIGRGYIPFARRLEGEDFKTPIDIINELFQMNIQVFLEDRSRVTKKQPGHPIPILHNGTNHFLRLEEQDPHVVMNPRIGEIIDKKPPSAKPKEFEMDPLLQAGYRGTIYQLLVLIAKITELLVQRTSFEAMFEAKGNGNLDDIIIVHKNEKNIDCKLQAFQVKHYEAKISAELFINKKNEKTKKKNSKNAKMHIGKFFHGWLSLKEKYPTLKDEDRESIIYTNTTLDSTLNKCVKNDVFSEKFIEGKESVNLQTRRIKGKNFYTIIEDQAWDYLKDKKLYPEIVEKRKKALFQQFLRSFRFKVGEKDYDPLIKSIIANLSIICDKRFGEVHPGQLFPHLYYAIGEWFVHNHKGSRNTSELTNDILIELMDSYQIRFHDAVKLQGVTEATLSNISYTCENQIIRRKELDELEHAMSKPGLVTVVGDKGIGKSGLVKQALAKRLPLEYLFISTEALIKDIKLKKKILKVLEQVEMVRLIVLDSAEALLPPFPKDDVQHLLRSLLQSQRTVILTLTPIAYDELAIQQVSHRLDVQPLPIEALLKVFPQLKPYQEIGPLIELARIPFYLKIILELISQNQEELNRIVKAKNTALDAQLIKQVVKGRDKNLGKERQMVWKQLASTLAQSLERTRNVVALKQTSIVVLKDGRYVFSHDLFFEHGLMAFWLDDWRLSCIKQKTLNFWKKLPKYLEFNSPIAVLAKWFSLHKEKLEPDLLEHAKELSTAPVFESIVAMAIVTEDKKLLEALLEHRNEGPMQKRAVDSNVMLAIFHNSPEALKALFKLGEPAHHPEAGTLLLLSESACYSQHRQNADLSSEESSSDESSIDWGVNSEDDSSEDFSYSESEEVEEESPMERFCGHVAKYWSAGFYEEPDYLDDEGEWIKNPSFQPLPRNDTSYLHQAVLLNRRDCLYILLDQYEEPQMINFCNDCEETLLHLGILVEATDVVELLLDKGALVNMEDYWGETPLHNVAYTGNIQLAELLLQRGANPNTLSTAGLTPLQIAVVRLDLQMVKLFLTYEGDLSIKPFHSEEITAADLLDHLNYNNPQEKMEEFVIELIETLHFGWNQEMNEIDEDKREIVVDLMTLIEHRAQLSEEVPEFDYYDSETELDYTLNTYNSKIGELTSDILDDPERIAKVLESEAVANLKQDLVKDWLEEADEEQYQNLKDYAEEYDDPETLAWIQEYEPESEEDV